VPKAYSYIRFSSPEQEKGDSLRRQTAAAVAYCERHGLELDTELTLEKTLDRGISAFRGKNSATGALSKFLEEVRDGGVPEGSALLVENLDRISRQAARKALRVLEEIVDAGITLVTLNDGRTYDAESLNSDPMSLILSVLTFIRGHEESQTKSRRIAAAWVNKRAHAAEKPLTAKCPGWLKLREDRSGFDLIPERTAIVRRIFQEVAAGRGLGAIAAGLNADGLKPFGKGKMWGRGYLGKLLASQTVLGTYTPGRSEDREGLRVRVPEPPVPNYYPPVISAELWEATRRASGAERGPHPGRAGGAVKNVLAGALARCPTCGGAMQAVNKGARSPGPRYQCASAIAKAGCDNRNSAAVRHVEAALLGPVQARAFIASAPSPSKQVGLDEAIQALRDDITGGEGEVENLVDALADGNPPAALLARLRTMEADLEKMRGELVSMERARDAAAGPLVRARLREAEAALSADPVDRAACNAALRRVLKAVTVNAEDGLLRLRWLHAPEAETHLLYMPFSPVKAG